jgi:hypothetical protein
MKESAGPEGVFGAPRAAAKSCGFNTTHSGDVLKHVCALLMSCVIVIAAHHDDITNDLPCFVGHACHLKISGNAICTAIVCSIMSQGPRR